MKVDRLYTQQDRTEPLPTGFDVDPGRETESGSPKTIWRITAAKSKKDKIWGWKHALKRNMWLKT